MDMHETILSELEKIEQQYGVRILHAVESGGRAWGFAYPNNDYAVRFIYVRPVADYLQPEEFRNVIECKLCKQYKVLYIVGWDLQIAMTQFWRGNAILFEWCYSPVVYKTTSEWDKIRETANEYFSERTAVYHYYGMAQSAYLSLTRDKVHYKKYFYALRPLLAVMWIEQKHEIPPVLFDDLLKLELDSELRVAINDLIEKKKTTREWDYNPHIPVILDFIEDALSRQKSVSNAIPKNGKNDLSPLNNCYLQIVGLELPWE